MDISTVALNKYMRTSNMLLLTPKIVKISQLEVEILGIEDMKGTHSFDDSGTSFILFRCVT